MSDDKRTGTFLRQEDAFLLLEGIQDKKTRGLTAGVTSILFHKALAGSKPSGDFDLLYFTEILVEFFANRQDLIARVLDGTYEDWPE